MKPDPDPTLDKTLGPGPTISCMSQLRVQPHYEHRIQTRQDLDPEGSGPGRIRTQLDPDLAGSGPGSAALLERDTEPAATIIEIRIRHALCFHIYNTMEN